MRRSYALPLSIPPKIQRKTLSLSLGADPLRVGCCRSQHEATFESLEKMCYFYVTAEENRFPTSTQESVTPALSFWILSKNKG